MSKRVRAGSAGLRAIYLANERGRAAVQLLLDADDGRADAFLRRDEMLGREDVQIVETCAGFAGGRVDDGQGVDLVAEQLDAQGEFLIRGPELDDIAAHPESATLEGGVVAFVLNIDEAIEQLVAFDRARPC